MRFRAKGPIVHIAWAIGPGLQFPIYSKAQRVGRSCSLRTAGLSGLLVVVANLPGPIGPGYLNYWAFGPNHSSGTWDAPLCRPLCVNASRKSPGQIAASGALQGSSRRSETATLADLGTNRSDHINGVKAQA